MTWGEQNSEEEAWEQLDYAVSQGINFIDTGGSPPAASGRRQGSAALGCRLTQVASQAQPLVADSQLQRSCTLCRRGPKRAAGLRNTSAAG